MEVALRRVLREAGARVVPNMQLRDAGVRGARRQAAIEAAAFGLPLRRGVPLFVDITMVSPLRADGQPRPGATETDGLAAAEAEHRKRAHVYPALAQSTEAHLQVIALEVGGRWSTEAVGFVKELALARAR